MLMHVFVWAIQLTFVITHGGCYTWVSTHYINTSLHSWNILMVYVSSNKGVMQHYYRRVLQRMLQQTGSTQETL